MLTFLPARHINWHVKVIMKSCLSVYHHRVLVVSPDMDTCGPSTFLPASRNFARCATISRKAVQFDFGQDNVVIAIICGSDAYFMQ